jgi:NodT family efflux transporter outer membrane factor (OMF) lipoprotein
LKAFSFFQPQTINCQPSTFIQIDKMKISIKINKIILAVMLLPLVFYGCAAVGPNYAPPEISVPSQWNAVKNQDEANKIPKAGSPSPESLCQWWSHLNDPVLSDLIARAIDHNFNVKESMARIREARAKRGVSLAQGFPVIDMAVSETTSRSSANMGLESTRRLYSAGFDAGWEIDLFGGTRRSVEAASADLDAALYSHGNVLVSLISEVALNYLDVRTLQARILTAEKNLQKQIELLDLAQAKYRAGTADAVEVNQAKTNLDVSNSGIPGLKTGLVQAKNRIAVLLGGFPGTMDKTLSASTPMPTASLDIAVGIPAEVLRQRPDVRAAERSLAAQTARIGVARAQRYPKLTLAGSIGLDALAPGDLFTDDGRNHSFGPRLSWRIFDAGALRRTEHVQEAVADQAFFQYRTAVLTALEEVENALSAFAREQQRLASLKKGGQSASETLELTFSRYEAGLIDFQTVLESQKSLLSMEDQITESQGAVITDLIRLYKAIGGGWQSAAQPRALTDANSLKSGD